MNKQNGFGWGKHVKFRSKDGLIHFYTFSTESCMCREGRNCPADIALRKALKPGENESLAERWDSLRCYAVIEEE